MERAPSDNQERCALVKRGHHEVEMKTVFLGFYLKIKFLA